MSFRIGGNQTGTARVYCYSLPRVRIFRETKENPIGRAVKKASFASAAFGLAIMLSGCALLPVKRRLPVPKAPAIVQSVTPEELISTLNQRWQALETLYVKVDIRATELKSKEGVAETLPESDGWILLRKPEMLRVTGNYLGMRAFDMVGNGDAFTLEIPLKNRAIEGSYRSAEKSANPLYNLRPGFFFDAIFVEGLKSQDHYSVIANTETVEDPAKKHLLSVPEYILNIARLNPDSPKMTESRVVTIHREDLLPYKQDIYDGDGSLQSEIQYRDYRAFKDVKYPSAITIECPAAGIQIDLTVNDVKENMDLPENAFQLTLPPDTKVEHLK